MPLHPHSTPAPSGSDPPKPKANDDEKIFPASRSSTEETPRALVVKEQSIDFSISRSSTKETPKALVVKEQSIDLSIAPKGKFNANLGKVNHILEWFSLGRFIWEVSRSTPHHLQVIVVYFQNHFR
jgi:hypothetical protein